MRSKKWYKFLWHFLDLTLVQGWVLHRTSNEGKSISLKNLKFFVSNALMIGGKITRKRGRASQVPAEYVEKQRRGPAAPIPNRSI